MRKQIADSDDPFVRAQAMKFIEYFIPEEEAGTPQGDLPVEENEPVSDLPVPEKEG